MIGGRGKWDPRGKHCYVTGGSSGLGLALALLLARKGANVSIVARNKKSLKEALAQLEAARVNKSQIFNSYSFALDAFSTTEDAFNAACEPYGGRSPDAVFLCAGKATPGFYIEQDEESIRRGMDSTFWVASWSAFVASRHMVRHRQVGKIVFVSSVLGYMSMLGYSTYAPGKHAIRGLAEGLRQELLLYSIDVHLYFPATIFSPGYVEENKTKPKLLLELEATDDGLSPEKCAEGLFKGLQRGDFHITDTFICDAFRTNTRGSTPHGSQGLRDACIKLIGLIALPLWRRGVDKSVIAHRQEHSDYLSAKQFFVSGDRVE
ncbi:oxidoreductase [Stereum hirsutum FP-91666 SS1]|uniref:oxidoreductase n=1 Tax=Stereum hirsutum (strain FP-91666) TaxID=721885 RepID=UPI000440B757|nr:oxidoreductase [Stereum hirsutum FP-91666 SS1]EIM91633.1 oxidoreductase [Stereum hirsutum FP-91666 SS1]